MALSQGKKSRSCLLGYWAVRAFRGDSEGLEMVKDIRC